MITRQPCTCFTSGVNGNLSLKSIRSKRGSLQLPKSTLRTVLLSTSTIMEVQKSSELESAAPATHRANDDPDMPDASNDVGHPHRRRTRRRSFEPSASSIPVCAWICVTFVLLIWVLDVVASRRPLYHIFLTFLSLLPALIVAKLVLSRFQDEAVSKSYLFSQFLLGAIPLPMIVGFVEILFMAPLGFLLFSSEFHKLRDIVLPRIDLFGTAEGEKEIFESIGKVIPLWKLFTGTLFFAIVVGVAEEVGKWSLARRYKQVDLLEENVNLERRIGCRGIISIACMGALGFATLGSYIYLVRLTAPTLQLGFFKPILFFRGLLGFPIHVGVQFYVAVTAAHSYVFDEPKSVTWSLCIAILVHVLSHGMITMMFFLLLFTRISSWIYLLVGILECCVVVLLMLVCRGKYKALLEREQFVLVSSDAV